MMSHEKMVVVFVCGRCLETQHITVGAAELRNWEQGELIQNAMPYLSADEREVLISGTCGPCFDKMFGEDPIGDADTEYDIDFEEKKE